MNEDLTIEVRHEQDCTIVTLAGEIDIATAADLRERLFELAATGLPLVADLGQVSYIDSAGLGVLVGTIKRAESSGSTLQVACAQPRIRQLFRLTGLYQRIPLTRTLEDARQALELGAESYLA